MKTNILVTGLFLLAGLVSSCQSEMEEAKGYGYLQLSSVEVNKSVTTRADITSTEAIAVDVIDESALVVKHADDWNEMNDVLLPVATYTIKAYSADKDKEAQGFDAAPYYEGQTEVAIEQIKLRQLKLLVNWHRLRYRLIVRKVLKQLLMIILAQWKEQILVFLL